MPTRQEYRKFNFKRNDGVLKSLEYMVHTTITDPPLEDYLKLEQERVTLTEEVGQRLVDMILCSDSENITKLVVDITKPIVSMNKQSNDGDEFYTLLEKLVLKILEKNKKLIAS